MTNDFYPGMKVSLHGEIGVVTKDYSESDGTYYVDGVKHQGPHKHFGLIRWDSNKSSDFEDWKGLFGSFKEAGGKELSPNYKFKFINADGSLKQKIRAKTFILFLTSLFTLIIAVVMAIFWDALDMGKKNLVLLGLLGTFSLAMGIAGVILGFIEIRKTKHSKVWIGLMGNLVLLLFLIYSLIQGLIME